MRESQLAILDSQELRRRAEAQVSTRTRGPDLDASFGIRGLIHELSVHHVELDLQNEELRATHEELEQARSRYYDLYEEAPVAYLTISGSGGLVSCNRMAMSLLGLNQTSFSRRQFLDLLAPAYHARYTERRDLLALGQESDFFEAKIRRQDGTRFWATVHLSAASRKPGAESIVRVAIIDNDDRKRSEGVVDRLASIVASSNLIIFSHDLSGIIVSWNDAAADLLGYTSEEMIGKNSSLLLPPERKGEDVLITSRLARGERVACDTVRVHSDGTHISVGLTASPIFNHSGTMVGVSQALRDIRQEVASHEAQQLQMLNLREHQDVLELADRRKDELIATLAHELRNPLAAIRNAAALVGHSADLDRRSRAIIERQVAQMAVLMEDLFDVTRMSHDQVVMRSDLLQLSDVLEFAVESVGSLIRTKQHQLRMEIPERGLVVRGDMGRLIQVFGNLLSNAAKYTPPQGTITLTAERATGEVVIRVRDSGIGMEGTFLPRAFDLFSQVGQSMNRAEGGLGLGLYLVRKLVELHQGSVSVVSAGLGEGSEFIVRLPLADEFTPAASP